MPDSITARIPSPVAPFPLVRHLSCRISRILVRMPVVPNHITLVSIGVGLAAAIFFALGDKGAALTGSLLLIVSYILDNCDGEVARAKNLTSRFGMLLDTFGDWLIHALLFIGLGLGAMAAFGQVVWIWMGLLAALGATINAGIGLWREFHSVDATDPEPARVLVMPERWRDKWLFAFRELSRADFCFLVLILALADGLWLLLPASAIGAQVYWITAFAEGADRFHV